MAEGDQNPIQNRSKLRFFNMKFRAKKKTTTTSGNEPTPDINEGSKKRMFGIFKSRQKAPVSKENPEELNSNIKEVVVESSIKVIITSPEKKSSDKSDSLKSDTSTSQISRKESWLHSTNVENCVEKKTSHRFGEHFANVELVYVKECGTKVPVVLKGLVSERKDAFERKIKEMDEAKSAKLENTRQTRRHLRPKVLNFEPKFDPKREKTTDYKFKSLGLSSWNPSGDKKGIQKRDETPEEQFSSIFGEEKIKMAETEKFEGQDDNNPSLNNLIPQTDERSPINSNPDHDCIGKPLKSSKDLPTIQPEMGTFLDDSNKYIPSMCFLQDRETIKKYLKKLREVLKEEHPLSSREWIENNVTPVHDIGTNYQDEINGLLKSVFLIRKQIRNMSSTLST